MAFYEYLVVPAPTKGLKERGIKGPENRFAKALEQVMNEFGAAGWEFQRSDTLPSEDRQGISGKTTNFRTVLVFRRELEEDLDGFQPELLEAPDEPAPQPQPEPEPEPKPEPVRREPPMAAAPEASEAKDPSQ